ncbi:MULTISPECIES: hypothetical protein [unclassified Streptomyces]|uniref:hypothetical protein n=1 Tax=unclassified Streptomyces TaxID=2593676 RepID=UPI0033199680
MGPELRVIIYPPDAQGGRRVRVDGEILGAALGPGDLLEFLRRAGLDPDDVHLENPLLIEVARRRACRLDPWLRSRLVTPVALLMTWETVPRLTPASADTSSSVGVVSGRHFTVFTPPQGTRSVPGERLIGRAASVGGPFA